MHATSTGDRTRHPKLVLVSTYGLRDEPNGVLVFRGMRNDHVTRSAQADKFDDGKIEICNCTQFR